MCVDHVGQAVAGHTPADLTAGRGADAAVGDRPAVERHAFVGVDAFLAAPHDAHVVGRAALDRVLVPHPQVARVEVAGARVAGRRRRVLVERAEDVADLVGQHAVVETGSVALLELGL